MSAQAAGTPGNIMVVHIRLGAQLVVGLSACPTREEESSMGKAVYSAGRAAGHAAVHVVLSYLPAGTCPQQLS